MQIICKCHGISFKELETQDLSNSWQKSISHGLQEITYSLEAAIGTKKTDNEAGFRHS